MRRLLLTLWLLTGGVCHADPTIPPAASLTDRDWRFLQVGNHGFEGQRAPATLRLDSGPGEAVATLGCNQIRSPYRLLGHELTVGMVTRSAYPCPPSVRRLERRLVRLLPTLRTWAVEGDRLMLKDDQGRVIATLQAVEASAPPPAAPPQQPDQDRAAADYLPHGPTWQVTHIDGEPTARTALSRVVFDAREGAFTLSLGCNTLSGPVTADAGTLRFGPLTLTEADCGPALNAVERRLLDALSARTLRVAHTEGGPLRLHPMHDGSGTPPQPVLELAPSG